MNSHWLKQVYARMLTENSPQDVIKIFKQEEGETEADHVATIPRTVYPRVTKILKANNLNSENANMELINQSLTDAGINVMSEKADLFKNFVTESGLTFTKENQKACNRLFRVSADVSDTISFLDALESTYNSTQVKTHFGQFEEIIGETISIKSVGAGPGEEAINFFTGGKKPSKSSDKNEPSKGDCYLGDGYTIELKAWQGRLPEIGPWVTYLDNYFNNGETDEDYRNLLISLSTIYMYGNKAGLVRQALNSFLSGSLDSIIMPEKEKVTQMLKNKREGSKADWVNNQVIKYMIFAIGLKAYSVAEDFNYFCFIVSTGSDYELRFINTTQSLDSIFNHLISNKDKFPFKINAGAGKRGTNAPQLTK